MVSASIDWHPSRQHLRGFGAAAVVVFGVLGLSIVWRQTVFGIPLTAHTAEAVAAGCWMLAAACGALRSLAPQALRPLYVGMIAASLPIAFVVSRVAMGVVFFGVFTPIALVFRMLGRDPLRRVFDRGASTYWTRRTPAANPSRYFDQF